MGMELHGINPQNHNGKIYRNSIWIWHPLWNYLEINYKDLILNINGHSNDEDFLSEELCKQLAQIIFEDCSNSKIQNYLDEYDSFINSLPETVCEYCLGFGYERVNLIYATNEKCFRCYGSGKSKMFVTNYKTYLYDFYMFAMFLDSCGGCKIL